MEVLSNETKKDAPSSQKKWISLYENGDITVLEETVEDDWYAPRLIYHKTIKFRDNKTGECYRLKQTIQRRIRVVRPKVERFGEAAKVSAEENKALTTFGEEVFIEHPDEHDKRSAVKKDTAAVKVSCRNCGGEHWTHSCQAPKKESTLAASIPSHYVPPAMRQDAEKRRVTVKISNIPEETERDELKEMFAPCGRIYRVNVPRDRKTGEGRGFAFIDFNDQEGAIAAVVMMNGQHLGYQVISVEFALNKEGNKIDIVIDDAARVKAEQQFAQGKEVEAKRNDVYQPAPRARAIHDDRRDHDDERVTMSFTRGSHVSDSHGSREPREPTMAERSSNWFEAGRATTSGSGWQPRTRSGALGSRSSAFGSRRDSPGGKPSSSKMSGGGWGDRSKRM